ncbi:hypothetical protein BN982_00766 [Halobacillus karajensis]|uniref:DUF4871 domain-containing protein n=1 Tax=Halobacillus karajensis TaxID=195088 RepID=A0A059NXD1_9BACI|nr:hypothetical protein BN982_00766 [Halobacillus karajensis]CDQ23435.1 hypothetical protein BN983_01662 [Halobacillus karajensis]CDQ26917.1 hypothetical protein BN981_01142 [Halobacillus karajensis]
MACTAIKHKRRPPLGLGRQVVGRGDNLRSVSYHVFYMSLILLLFGLVGCSDKEWEESGQFKSGPYQMIGEEGRLGIIYSGGEFTKFYPDRQQKYMWHFWGEEEELEGDLKVIGTSEETGREVVVLEDVPIAVKEHNGADASAPTLMSLPKSGMWKLEAYIDDTLHGSVYVHVHEEE